MNSLELLLNSSRGIYIPKNFVDDFDMTLWKGIDSYDINTCTDIENEFYWAAWDNILQNAELHLNGHVYRLWHDGDLWLYCYELMTDEEKSNFFEEVF